MLPVTESVLQNKILIHQLKIRSCNGDWAMKYARTFYGRCNNLLRTSARTHKLEMKGFRHNFVLFGVLTVISHLIQSSDLLGPLWKGKMFANIQI